MVVSADKQADVVRAYRVGHFIPVVHISFYQRVVGDEDYGLVEQVHSFRHPTDILWNYMAVCHTHQRAGVETEEQDALMLEFKTFATEDFFESCAAGITPFRFVIAEDDIVFDFQQIQRFFYFQHGGAITFFGNIARHQYKVDTVCRINLCYGAQQVFCRIGIVGAEMNVRYLGKTECSVIRIQRSTLYKSYSQEQNVY